MSKYRFCEGCNRVRPIRTGEEYYSICSSCGKLGDMNEPVSNTDELKDCPFCYDPEFPRDESNCVFLAQDKEWWGVVCNYCGASGLQERDKYLAIEAWNNRPIEDALNNRIIELEAEIEKHKQLWVDDVDRLQDRIAIQRGIVENHVIQERVLSEEIATLQESQRWIPVSERLPDAVDKNAGSYQTREIAYRHIGSPIYYQFISYGYLRTDGWVRCRILDEKLDQELYEVTYWKERTYPKESAE